MIGQVKIGNSLYNREDLRKMKFDRLINLRDKLSDEMESCQIRKKNHELSFHEGDPLLTPKEYFELKKAIFAKQKAWQTFNSIYKERKKIKDQNQTNELFIEQARRILDDETFYEIIEAVKLAKENNIDFDKFNSRKKYIVNNT